MSLVGQINSGFTAVGTAVKARLVKTNNLSDLSNVATARSNLSVPAKAETPYWCPTVTMQGVATARTGTVRLYVPAGTYTVVSATVSVSTAPTGSALVVDVNKNGTTMFSTKPQVAASAFTGTQAANASTSVTTGDYITVDIDSIGSTVAGSDVVVTVVLQRTA